MSFARRINLENQKAASARAEDTVLQRRGPQQHSSRTLKEIFNTDVMCDFTPRAPKQFPTSQWVSLEQLSSQLSQHAPDAVLELGHGKYQAAVAFLRQLITKWYKDHPAFEGLPLGAWGKRLKDNDPRQPPIFKFSFEHTPGAIRRGLQAGPIQPHNLAGDTSETGAPAPCSLPPPSLRPAVNQDGSNHFDRLRARLINLDRIGQQLISRLLEQADHVSTTPGGSYTFRFMCSDMIPPGVVHRKAFGKATLHVALGLQHITFSDIHIYKESSGYIPLGNQSFNMHLSGSAFVESEKAYKHSEGVYEQAYKAFWAIWETFCRIAANNMPDSNNDHEEIVTLSQQVFQRLSIARNQAYMKLKESGEETVRVASTQFCTQASPPVTKDTHSTSMASMQHVLVWQSWSQFLGSTDSPGLPGFL